MFDIVEYIRECYYDTRQYVLYGKRDIRDPIVQRPTNIIRDYKTCARCYNRLKKNALYSTCENYNTCGVKCQNTICIKCYFVHSICHNCLHDIMVQKQLRQKKRNRERARQNYHENYLFSSSDGDSSDADSETSYFSTIFTDNEDTTHHTCSKTQQSENNNCCFFCNTPNNDGLRNFLGLN